MRPLRIAHHGREEGQEDQDRREGIRLLPLFPVQRRRASRVRLPQADLDVQILALFDRLRVENEEVRDWFQMVLRARTREQQRASQDRLQELDRQLAQITAQQDRLLNLRLNDEIEADTYGRKSTELRDREAKLRLQVEACSRGRQEDANTAVKAFELTQSLQAKWKTADYVVKRRILEILWLNFVLDDVTLVPTMRKPFDVLAEGLLSGNSRGDPRLIFPNQTGSPGLLWLVLPQPVNFTGDLFVEPASA